jgi:hypothetical protein
MILTAIVDALKLNEKNVQSAWYVLISRPPLSLSLSLCPHAHAIQPLTDPIALLSISKSIYIGMYYVRMVICHRQH